MRPLLTALAAGTLSTMLAPAAALAAAPPHGTPTPGTGLAGVTITGEAPFSGSVPVRVGVDHVGLAPVMTVSFGGHPALPASFSFALAAPQAAEPLPATVAFLRDQGFDDTGIAAFLLADRDGQLALLTSKLTSPEALREALAAGKMPDLDDLASTIPPEVTGDLDFLRELRASGLRTHTATLTVREPLPDGETRVRHGSGMLELRFDTGHEGDTEARYAGAFWGGYDGDAGPVWVEGSFAGAPFVPGEHPLFASSADGWDRDDLAPQASRFEAVWPEPYPIASFSVAIPTAWSALSHRLTIELLVDDGDWTRVAQTPLPPQEPEPAGPSPLAEDPEVAAFLDRVGLTLDELEEAIDRGMGAMVAVLWFAQGVGPDDRPSAIVERIEGVAPREAEPTDPPGPGWSERPPGFLSHKALTYRLEYPVHAHGVRFELHGAPFAGENWELAVDSGPVARPGGDVTYGWRYTHGW